MKENINNEKKQVIELFNGMNYNQRLIATTEGCYADINRIELEKQRLKRYYRKQITEMNDTIKNIKSSLRDNIRELKDKGYI